MKNYICSINEINKKVINTLILYIILYIIANFVLYLK